MSKAASNPDYIQLPDGRVAFSAHYHHKRGYCCGSGCRYCPFGYEAVKEPRRRVLQEAQRRMLAEENDGEV